MRGLSVVWQRTQDNNAVECSRELTARLERSVQAVQGRRLSLVSGAGHEGVVMSALTRSRCGFAVSGWAESPPGRICLAGGPQNRVARDGGLS